MPSKYDNALKTRAAALILADHTPQDIANSLGVPLRTVRYWRINVDRYGTVNPPAPASGRPRTLTRHHEEVGANTISTSVTLLTCLQALLEYLYASPDVYYDEMLWFLYDEFGIITSERAVRRIFKRRRWSRKQLKRVARQRSQALRQDWIYQIRNYTQRQFVFVDESAANERSMDRKYGWAPVGRPAIGIQDLKRHMRWSVLPAYTVDGYLPGYLLHQGSVVRDMFISWLRDHVLPYMRRFEEGKDVPRSILVMDNAKIHHGEEVERLCALAGVKLLYLPPYSPDLNPIEASFHDIKQRLRSRRHELSLFSSFEAFLRHTVDSLVGDGSRARGHFSKAGIKR